MSDPSREKRKYYLLDNRHPDDQRALLYFAHTYAASLVGGDTEAQEELVGILLEDLSKKREARRLKGDPEPYRFTYAYVATVMRGAFARWVEHERRGRRGNPLSYSGAAITGAKALKQTVHAREMLLGRPLSHQEFDDVARELREQWHDAEHRPPLDYARRITVLPFSSFIPLSLHSRDEDDSDVTDLLFYTDYSEEERSPEIVWESLSRSGEIHPLLDSLEELPSYTQFSRGVHEAFARIFPLERLETADIIEWGSLASDTKANLVSAFLGGEDPHRLLIAPFAPSADLYSFDDLLSRSGSRAYRWVDLAYAASAELYPPFEEQFDDGDEELSEPETHTM